MPWNIQQKDTGSTKVYTFAGKHEKKKFLEIRQHQSFLGPSRIIGSLDRKINDVIAAISINDDRFF